MKNNRGKKKVVAPASVPQRFKKGSTVNHDRQQCQWFSVLRIVFLVVVANRGLMVHNEDVTEEEADELIIQLWPLTDYEFAATIKALWWYGHCSTMESCRRLICSWVNSGIDAVSKKVGVVASRDFKVKYDPRIVHKVMYEGVMDAIQRHVGPTGGRVHQMFPAEIRQGLGALSPQIARHMLIGSYVSLMSTVARRNPTAASLRWRDLTIVKTASMVDGDLSKGSRAFRRNLVSTKVEETLANGREDALPGLLQSIGYLGGWAGQETTTSVMNEVYAAQTAHMAACSSVNVHDKSEGVHMTIVSAEELKRKMAASALAAGLVITDWGPRARRCNTSPGNINCSTQPVQPPSRTPIVTLNSNATMFKDDRGNSWFYLSRGILGEHGPQKQKQKQVPLFGMPTPSPSTAAQPAPSPASQRAAQSASAQASLHLWQGPGQFAQPAPSPNQAVPSPAQRAPESMVADVQPNLERVDVMHSATDHDGDTIVIMDSDSNSDSEEDVRPLDPSPELVTQYTRGLRTTTSVHHQCGDHLSGDVLPPSVSDTQGAGPLGSTANMADTDEMHPSGNPPGNRLEQNSGIGSPDTMDENFFFKKYLRAQFNEDGAVIDVALRGSVAQLSGGKTMAAVLDLGVLDGYAYDSNGQPRTTTFTETHNVIMAAKVLVIDEYEELSGQTLKLLLVSLFLLLALLHLVLASSLLLLAFCSCGLRLLGVYLLQLAS
eukprot:gene21607-28607_t